MYSIKSYKYGVYQTCVQRCIAFQLELFLAQSSAGSITNHKELNDPICMLAA